MIMQMLQVGYQQEQGWDREGQRVVVETERLETAVGTEREGGAMRVKGLAEG